MTAGTALGLGVLGLSFVATRSVAQQMTKQAENLAASEGRLIRPLTVRPRAMATGTRTAQAGWQRLEGIEVYVPLQCVGTRRCPLFLSTSPFGVSGADKYGFILAGLGDDPRQVDRELPILLRSFAIDPDKIAIMGHCATGKKAMALAAKNLDVFSRIVVVSAPETAERVAALGPPNGRAEFLVMAGIDEIESDLETVVALRRAGHPVTHALTIRNHAYYEEDWIFITRWLYTSWNLPAAARPAPDTVPEVLLTPEAIAKMTAFWTRFMTDNSNSAYLGRTVYRRLALRDVTVPAGSERLTGIMTNMSANPFAGLLLRAAGLSAAEHDAYRVAYLSARYTRDHPGLVAQVSPASVLGRNIDFLDAHPDELEALAATNIWHVP